MKLDSQNRIPTSNDTKPPTQTLSGSSLRIKLESLLKPLLEKPVSLSEKKKNSR